MDKEEIIQIIRDEVSKEFGVERIKDIEYSGPYEGEDLDVLVYVEGIDERKDGLDVGMRLSDKFYEMDLDVPIAIMRAREGVGEEVAA
ncbi:MAG: hypothetical protein C4B59_09140 [Candidatus Methanogaster sp.]|uniref:Uncharacterized protein n=1 Tax=Candidatus Methanogaster sp. TaxID=3386292 RepID=A0AC61L2T6_9EURY|nr:MAG: hypothetical protein C4B59_09140 [ANME-2 cluster archaeon]